MRPRALSWPRLSLPTGLPADRRAVAFSGLWLVTAGLSMWAAVGVAIHATSSTPLRILGALALAGLSTAALMLASDSIERSLAGRLRGWSDWLQWLSTSVVALAVVVVLGAPLTVLAPNLPSASNLALDLFIDLVLGAVAGAVAVGMILAATALLGHAIWRVQLWLGLEGGAETWKRPAHAWRRVPRHIGRGAAMGAAGLVLSAICTAVVTTVTPNHNGAADTPHRIETNPFLTIALPVVAWLVGTGIVWLLVARGGRERFKPHPRLRHGTHGTALSIGLVIVLASFAAAGIERQARDELWSGKNSTVPTVRVGGEEAGLTSSYLAEQFEPELRLTSGEHWTPTSVNWYVRQNPRPTTDTPFCDAHSADQRPAGCYQISAACDGANPGPCAINGADDPALYYRYVHAAQDTQDSSAPPTTDGWTVIQYWVFYNYDSLHTSVVTQWHQSDWEQVSVLVRRQGSLVRPVEVAFSEHCYGARLPAERVRWTDGSHPVVFVARGSHANYPRPVSVPVRQLRCSLGITPRYLGVAGLFFSPAFDGSRLEIPAAYLIGLRDQADGARSTPRLPLLPLGRDQAILSFDGHWGLDNNLSLPLLGRIRASAGPPAPQSQAPWQTPFRSMLCSDTWLSTPPISRAETAWTCGSQS